MRETFTNLRHQRRHSWPPMHIRKTRPARQSINDNPFAYFISQPEEPRSYLFDHVDADIQPPSPLDAPRSSLDRIRQPLACWQACSTLRKAVNKAKSLLKRLRRGLRRSDKAAPETEDTAKEESDPIMILEQMCIVEARQEPEPPKHFPPKLVARSVRSHSSRPRSWIEPHADLWTVLEESSAGGQGRSHSVAIPPTRRPYP